MNRYYRQAWENLHESAGSKTGLKVVADAAHHSPLRRKETMDTERHREGSELVVSDVAAYPPRGQSEKKRHHHHHHHHNDGRGPHKESGRGEWRSPHHNHKRY